MVGQPSHPWTAWADGDAHCITQGTDFTCSIKSMREQLRARARWLEADVVIWEREPGVLWFLFVDLEDEDDDLADGVTGR